MSIHFVDVCCRFFLAVERDIYAGHLKGFKVCFLIIWLLFSRRFLDKFFLIKFCLVVCIKALNFSPTLEEAGSLGPLSSI